MSAKHLSIGFIPEMAVAALRAENPKTLTTRLSGLKEVNHEPAAWTLTRQEHWWAQLEKTNGQRITNVAAVYCRYTPGERRRLLTTWAVPKHLDDLKPSRIDFDGDGDSAFWHAGMGTKPMQWAGKNRPGNFLPGVERTRMPEVEIVSVRLARMQSITEAEAVAEGVEPIRYMHNPFQTGIHAARFTGEVQTRRDAFRQIIIRINGADAWDKNPWVWRISFKLVSRGSAL